MSLRLSIVAYASSRRVKAMTEQALDFIWKGSKDQDFYDQIKHCFHIEHNDIYHVYHAIDCVDHNLDEHLRDQFISNLSEHDISIDDYDKSLYVEEFQSIIGRVCSNDDLKQALTNCISRPIWIYYDKGNGLICSSVLYDIERFEAYSYINDILQLVKIERYYNYYFKLQQAYHQSVLEYI